VAAEAQVAHDIHHAVIERGRRQRCRSAPLFAAYAPQLP
jgi:hypothetical protein